MGLNITDLPTHIQRQIADKQRKPGEVEVKPEKKPTAGIRLPKEKKPNATEARYGELLQREFPLYELRYEEFTFRMAAGNYTADWTVWSGATLVLVVEVKNAYRFHSAGRSHMAFKAAREKWPAIKFRFAKFDKESGWAIAE